MTTRDAFITTAACDTPPSKNNESRVMIKYDKIFITDTSPANARGAMCLQITDSVLNRRFYFTGCRSTGGNIPGGKLRFSAGFAAMKRERINIGLA